MTSHQPLQQLRDVLVPTGELGTGEAPRSPGKKCRARAPTPPPTLPVSAAPTHQLDALGERVVLPVLLWEALQDLALAFPTP